MLAAEFQPIASGFEPHMNPFESYTTRSASTARNEHVGKGMAQLRQHITLNLHIDRTCCLQSVRSRKLKTCFQVVFRHAQARARYALSGGLCLDQAVYSSGDSSPISYVLFVDVHKHIYICVYIYTHKYIYMLATSRPQSLTDMR